MTTDTDLHLNLSIYYFQKCLQKDINSIPQIQRRLLEEHYLVIYHCYWNRCCQFLRPDVFYCLYFDKAFIKVTVQQKLDKLSTLSIYFRTKFAYVINVYAVCAFTVIHMDNGKPEFPNRVIFNYRLIVMQKWNLIMWRYFVDMKIQ